MTATFGRLLSAMVTPFDQDENLDLDAAQALASWLVDTQGHEGLVLAGTTGESPTLTHEEQGQLFRAVREAVTVPLVAGTGSNDTRAAIDLTKRAVAAGADGILVVTPYYNRPSQAALVDYFTAVAVAGDDVPTIIYDIPVRTGRKVETENLLALAHDVSNIVGIKDAAGDPGETAMLLTQAPDGFEVYSGEDKLNLALLSVGAVGIIGVASHWAAPEMVQMVAAFEAGDMARARDLNQSLIASWDFQSGDDKPNPIPSKAMMKVLGRPGGDCRSPMGPEPDWLADLARDVIAGLGRPVS